MIPPSKPPNTNTPTLSKPNLENEKEELTIGRCQNHMQRIILQAMDMHALAIQFPRRFIPISQFLRRQEYRTRMQL